MSVIFMGETDIRVQGHPSFLYFVSKRGNRCTVLLKYVQIYVKIQYTTSLKVSIWYHHLHSSTQPEYNNNKVVFRNNS